MSRYAFSSISWSTEYRAGRPNSSKQLLDVKAFAAPALIFDPRVAELESLVEALFGVVELRAVDVLQALRVDQHLHAVALELVVLREHRIGELQLVRQPRAARGAHAHAQA